MAQYTKFSIRTFVCGLVALSTFGCVSKPSELFASKSRGYGFTQDTLTTTQFDLTIFANAAFQESSNDKSFHIYVGGDGQPFFRTHYISPDPTPRRALTLELMSLDDAPSIYIGRPCYHKRNARNCDDNKWWTTHRYSEPVVDAVRQAILSVLKTRSNARAKLIGFSGGGTLSVLLTPLIESHIESVITINPNLNIQKWTDHHGYTPLSGSINPYEQADLPTHISKHYLFGGHDSNVLSKHWLSHFEAQENTQLHRFDNFNHTCCWPEIWKQFLKNKIITP